MTPSGPIGIRSPGERNASAIIAAMAAAVTHSMGTMALRDDHRGELGWQPGLDALRLGDLTPLLPMPMHPLA